MPRTSYIDRCSPWGAALLLAALVSLPNLAMACPACAGREGGGAGYLIALGSMIVFPFFIVGFVGFVLQKAPTDL